MAWSSLVRLIATTVITQETADPTAKASRYHNHEITKPMPDSP
jgi:hypothetical protein